MGKFKGIGLTANACAARSDDDYQARDDMDTLRRAEEIRNNPARRNAATKMAQSHIKALSRIGGRK